VATTIIREFTLCAKITFVLLCTHSNNNNNNNNNCQVVTVQNIPGIPIFWKRFIHHYNVNSTVFNNAKDVHPVPSFTWYRTRYVFYCESITRQTVSNSSVLAYRMNFPTNNTGHQGYMSKYGLIV